MTGSQLHLGRIEPGVDFPLGLILGIAVALLQATGELRTLAVDDVHVIVRQLAPLLLDVALELFPVTFDAVPVHCCTPFGRLDLGETRSHLCSSGQWPGKKIWA